MVEFTGERVIPGQVNDDLWSEHVARYAFARRYAEGRRILDAGCGTGYGSAELAHGASSVIGIDLAPEAIEYARENYPVAGLNFVRASCAAFPFAAKTFGLVVAFEVIEHLSEFRPFLEECARVLAREGLLIVSSPNKAYYTESRAQTGPNPYHEHEFEAGEFASELGRVFPHVQLIVQNRVESFAFHPATTFWPVEARLDRGAGKAEDAHFLIGLCSFQPLANLRSFVYVPRAANVLREREHHIHLLEAELAEVQGWLREAHAERDSLLELFRKQKEELESRNRWAEQVSRDLDTSAKRVVQLQDELAAEQQAGAAVAAGYEAKVVELEEENRARAQWAVETEARLTRELEAKCHELAECVRLLGNAEATVEERTLWAQRAEAASQQLAAQLNMVRASRWIKLGRKVGLGPAIDLE